MKNKVIVITLLMIASVFIFSGCTPKKAKVPEIVKNTCGAEKWKQKVDYGDKSNWLSLPEKTDHDVDVVYFYPTVFSKSQDDDSVISDVDDEGMRKGAQGCLMLQASVFEQSCNIFAPFYRQVDAFYALTLTDEQNSDLLEYSASQDPSNALDYYFENCNNGKPFILAGHSQGSEILLFILSDYMKAHPEHLEKMVAAYVIGYSVTDSYLRENTHLKFAQGPDDVGVIVSWNTEGPANVGVRNAVVLDGAKSINPLNWKTDETYAGPEENLGSFINGSIVDVGADAKINLSRGTVITNADKSFVMPAAMNEIFGQECFHGQDYGFFYNNIKQNVKVRIDSYKSLLK